MSRALIIRTILWECIRLPFEALAAACEGFFGFTIAFFIAGIAGLWAGALIGAGWVLPLESLLYGFIVVPWLSVFTFWGIIVYGVLIAAWVFAAMSDDRNWRAAAVIFCVVLTAIDAARLASWLK